MGDGYGRRERNTVLLACCISGLVTPLLSTMMNLSLVSIGENFGVGSHLLAYVNTAFLLSSVIFMVPLARAGDIIGKKRMYLIGLAVIAIACLLASVSPSFFWLVGCRVMMGFGSAALVTTSVSLITDVFPSNARGGAIGLQTMCVYIGLSLGPPLGGTLNDLIGWHALFLFVVPLAVVAFLCMLTFRHEISPAAGRSFDGKGAVLYGVGILLAMGGVINMPETWAVVMLIVGVVVIGLFARAESGNPDHLLNVHLFRSKVFTGSCLATFLNYAASYSISYFLALYLQEIGAISATQAGILMLVQAAIQAVVTPLFGRFSDHVGDKRILPTCGMIITGIGVAMFLFYGLEVNYPLVVATMVIVGFGLGMFSAPNTSVIMGSVRPEETGEASAMVAVMRQSGMMVSMGIAMLFISVIMGGSDNLVPENYGSFLDVIHISFGVCLAMCVVGTFASFLRGRETSAYADDP